MKVKIDGRTRITKNVMIGLRKDMNDVVRVKIRKSTYEYHSQVEYSVVISNDSVRSPAWDVFDEAISEDSST
jgi:hypothetical protein